MDKVNFSVASIGKEEEDAVIRVLRSGWLTTGKETFAFENEFAEKIGAAHTLAVNSATSGLMLAFDACGIRENTKILTTPYTFASTALAARHLGAHIEYADIEKDSYNRRKACRRYEKTNKSYSSCPYSGKCLQNGRNKHDCKKI